MSEIGRDDVSAGTNQATTQRVQLARALGLPERTSWPSLLVRVAELRRRAEGAR